MEKYLIVLLACFSVVTLASLPKLQADNFQAYVVKNEFVLVRFFAPWCAYSQAMAEEYKHLYQNTDASQFKIVEVDCVAQQSLCKEQEILSYPTIKLYLNGIPLLYEFTQVSKDMFNWLKKIASLNLQLSTAEDIKQKIGTQTFVLSSGLQKNQQKILAVTNEYDKTETKYYALTSSTPIIRLYRKGSTQFVTYPFTNSILDQMSFQNWTFYQGRPSLFYQQDQYYVNRVVRHKKYTHILVFVDLQDSSADSYRNIVTQWCEKKLHDIICLGFRKSYKNFDSLKKIVMLTEERSSISFIQSDLKIGYNFNEQTTSVNLDKFYESAIEDKIYRDIDTQRDFKQRIKYTNVFQLTKDNYQQTIENNKVVFVQYYTPSSQPSFDIYPQYEKIALKVKEKGYEVIVSAINLEVQTGIAQTQSITTYPTFKYFLNGIGYLYQFNQDPQVILNFIQALATRTVKTVANRDELQLPFISISGISEKSNLFYLGAFYKRIALYHIADQLQFKVELTSGKNVTYTGQEDLLKVLEWIQQETSPVFVNLGDSIPSLKLKKAMADFTPILAVVNKFEDIEVIRPALQKMRKVCKETTMFICGYVNKGSQDYESIMGYIQDKDTSTNRLIWIDTKTYKKYMSIEDPNQTSFQTIYYFAMTVQNGMHPAIGQEPVAHKINPNKIPANVKLREAKAKAEAQVKYQAKQSKQVPKPADHTVEEL